MSEISESSVEEVVDRKRRRWPLVVVGAVVLILVVAVIAWQLLGARARASAQPLVLPVTRQNLSSTVGTTGTIDPAHEAELSFAGDGTVTSIKVGVGDTVHKGQKLASIGTSGLQADVESARAARDASEQNLTTLEDSGTASSADLASAKADLRVKKGQLQQAKAALAAATLTAPFDGVVAAVNISEGDSVGSGAANSSTQSSGSSGSDQAQSRASGAATSSNSSGSSGSAAITIINTSSWVVDATVGSADLPSVKKGQQVRITPTGSDRTVSGTVSSVGIMSDGSNDFPVKITINGHPTGLYAGSSANVSIVTRSIPQALTVPTIAVQSDGSQTYVLKMTGGRAVKTPITVGDTLGSRTVVTKGLAAGDRVEVPTLIRPNLSNGRNGGGLFGGRGGGRNPVGKLQQPAFPGGQGGR